MLTSFLLTVLLYGFPCGSAGKESARSAGDLGSILGWEGALEKGRATHSGILAGEFHGLYRPWVHKELDTIERLSLSHAFLLNGKSVGGP